LHNELVKSEALATGFGDSGTGGLGEAECSNCNFWHIKNTQVISDGTNNNSNSVLLCSKMLDELREGEWRTVGSGGHKSSEDSLGEG
jgi:hypothetical protein